MMKINKIKKINFINIFLFFVSFIISLILFANDAPREGLEYLFLLPLVYGLCLIVFNKVLNYKGLGLKVFHVITFIRFVVQPLLILLTAGEVSINRMSIVAPSSYYISTFIQCIEVIISYATIALFYEKVEKKYIHQYDVSKNDGIIGIKFGGGLVILSYLVVLLIRFPVWYPALNIYGLKQSITSGVLLENTLFSAVKTVLFIYILDKTIKARGKNKILYLFLCIFATLFLIMTYFGTNRSLTLELTVTSIVMIFHYLPKYRKLLLMVVVPLSFILIFTMFVTKQFALESTSELSTVSLDLMYISNQLEEYTNGPWCIAQTYEASIGLSFLDSFKAVIKELSNAMMVICVIPGLQQLSKLISHWQSATDIFRAAFQNRNRGQIPSFSAGFFYCFGYLGFILFPIGNFISIMFLIKYSIRSMNTDSLLERFVYLWSSILFGLTHCYCVRVLLYCMSKYAWFIFFIILGNKYLIYKRGGRNYEKNI